MFSFPGRATALAYALLLLLLGTFVSISSSSAAPSLSPNPADAYLIDFVHGSTNIAFNTSREANEVITFIKVSKDNLIELVDPINIHDFETCGDFNFDEIAISATANITGGAVTIDGPYATFPVAIDINTTDIGQYDGRPDYPGYFTRNTTLNTVTIKFCVKPELGNVLGVTDQNGNPVISSISYTKIKLIIDIDMEQGFDTASITVVEDTPYQGNQSVQIDYDCK